jgi:putative hydrolase of the HAD superfamily
MKSKNKKTFIFDLDDTLIWNAYDYSDILAEFYFYLRRKITPNCPYITDLLNMQREIDEKYTTKRGFNFRRFPLSFARTYKQICEDTGIEYNKNIADGCYRTGMKTFTMPNAEIVEGAKDCLEFLTDKGDELLLLTKGYKSIQQKKINQFDLGKYFSNITIALRSKDSKLFNEISGERDKNFVYSVGNSQSSDIIPALDAGLKAIYIPWEGGWNFNNHKLVHENLKRFRKIDEIVKNYEKL